MQQQQQQQWRRPTKIRQRRCHGDTDEPTGLHIIIWLLVWSTWSTVLRAVQRSCYTRQTNRVNCISGSAAMTAPLTVFFTMIITIAIIIIITGGLNVAWLVRWALFLEAHVSRKTNTRMLHVITKTLQQPARRFARRRRRPNPFRATASYWLSEWTSVQAAHLYSIGLAGDALQDCMTSWLVLCHPLCGHLGWFLSRSYH